MRVFVVILFAITLAAVLAVDPGAAAAQDYTVTGNVTVEDEMSCQSIGLQWDDSCKSCLLEGGATLTISSTATLAVQSEVAIVNMGSTIDNRGTFVISGTLGNQTQMVHPGTINNRGTIENHGILHNAGGAINRPSSYIEIQADGDIVNSGVISNRGTIAVSYGGFFSNTSTGTLNNEATGAVDLFGTIYEIGWLQNDGNIVNDGTFTMMGSACCPPGISNGGSFTNNGAVVGYGHLINSGVFVNACNAILDIFLLPEPEVVQLPCVYYCPLIAR